MTQTEINALRKKLNDKAYMDNAIKTIVMSGVCFDDLSKSRGKRGRSGKKGRKVRCIETEQIFDTAKEASLTLGLNKLAVSNAIRQNSRCGGYWWEYV